MKPTDTTPGGTRDHDTTTARGVVRGHTGMRHKAKPPWYLRKRIMFPLALILGSVVVAVFCWWNIPVKDQQTGESKTYGDIVTNTVQSILNPKKSLETAFPDQRKINVLLIGLDHVPATKGDPGVIRRSDSVMMATTDFDTKQIRIISIPRDGWVEHIQNGRSHGYERLANTFSLGQEENLRHHEPRDQGGINRTRESVANLLDIPVDYYVVIQFEGLVELVDELGGLLVDVEMNMDYDDNAGDLHVHFKKGEQMLTGEQVVQYARFRDKILADLGRMPRQQKVVRLILQKMMKTENLAKLPRIAEIMKDNVWTNLTLDQLVALAQNIKDYSPESIKTRTLTSYYDSDPTMEVQLPGIPEGEKRGAQCIYPKDAKKAKEFLTDLAPPPPPEPEPEPDESSTAENPSTAGD